jgi:hypothetical protein
MNARAENRIVVTILAVVAIVSLLCHCRGLLG